MAKHRCAAMKIAINNEYVEENLLNPAQVYVRQPKKLVDGTKGNRILLLNHCPWCGFEMIKP